ncbi:anaerobic ribonucleoside-triphosphate reductase activating protein [Congzhengia minquanensis]|uniref:Anaerobic ribonucleoside-triphosphate reductase-activating protein n=1 Tax=Congzhengia minquanensis TaxID=2763657 RepID=A0A926DQL4_9FIRM|nr:anaerobic ribonucleoside-triphosphate reductase activating protein [Congzhengia minquanensis]MBC8541500.1 anaerobic ribonucleoside-triphosphate reductase activating protein [Congzhengia minquanensis]
MNYSAIKTHDVANGIGVRVSLFVSGCTHHCKDCFNAETWDFAFGNPFGDAQVQQILEALKPDYIKGFSLLGGEPFEPQNQHVLAPLLKKIKQAYPDKTIWCYSGYLLDTELLSKSRARCEATDEMLSYIDILVDGEFVAEKKDLNLRFRGSSNQRIIDVPATLQAGKVVLSKEFM